MPKHWKCKLKSKRQARGGRWEGKPLFCYLGVLQVFEHVLLIPDHTLLHVGFGVGETGSLTRLAAENAVQIGTDLVGTTLLFFQEVTRGVRKNSKHPLFRMIPRVSLP
jgi:hypothetical protein